MSGRPHPQGVACVARLSRECLELEREHEQLAARVKADSARMKAIESQVAAKRNDRHVQMAKMDLVHSGNFGFEARLAAFLTMLAADAGTPPTQTPKE